MEESFRLRKAVASLERILESAKRIAADLTAFLDGLPVRGPQEPDTK